MEGRNGKDVEELDSIIIMVDFENHIKREQCTIIKRFVLNILVNVSLQYELRWIKEKVR